MVKSQIVSCFCTQKYFESKACARELVLSVALKKPLVALLEPDASKGGLTQAAVENLLTDDWLARFDFENELDELWGGADVPSAADVRAALFKEPQLEWHRLSAFQDITMRLLAERLLLGGRPAKPSVDAEAVYLQGELERVKFKANLRPRAGRDRPHLFYSAANVGVAKLVDELRAIDSGLVVTDRLEELPECDHALLYLTASTWTVADGAGVNEELKEYVEEVRAHRVHLLLAHERPSCSGPGRDACEFSEVIAATPPTLRSPRGGDGIYTEVATSLLDGAWRPAGLIQLLCKVAVTREELQRLGRIQESSGVLGRMRAIGGAKLSRVLSSGQMQSLSLLDRVQRSDYQPSHGESGGGMELTVEVTGRSERPRLSSVGVAISPTSGSTALLEASKSQRV